MDPLGFALENFDALGRYRTTDGNSPVDPTGVMPDGTRLDGPVTLRQALVAEPSQFASTVTERLLTYALGRGVEYYDRARGPTDRARERGGRLSMVGVDSWHRRKLAVQKRHRRRAHA